MFVATLALAASAQARYVEVWNPPEARAHTIPVTPKTVKHRHVNVPRARRARFPANAIAAPRARAAKHSGLTYETIPRKLTPEGNVLRVSASHTRAHLER